MVSTTSPEVTRMVMASGTNKWASRAVVILQLAAWSAVGIVLLQKGVSSLQKRPIETRNVTQIIPTKSAGIRHDNQQDLLVIPIVNDKNSKRQDKKLGALLDSIWNENLHDAEFLSDQQSTNINKQTINKKITSQNNKHIDEPNVMENIESVLEKQLIKEKLIKKKFYPTKKTAKTKLETNENTDINEFNNSNNNFKETSLPIKLINNKKLSNSNVDIKESQRQQLSMKTEGIVSSENSQQSINSNQTFGNNTNENKTISSPVITMKSGSNWETRRRLRLSHLSGGGAAAAVAMVAVGAVMLVLGPAVIVLRALDERRQERRFLKLSGRDDLPPSYEQATLMDEAPRYSSLSLNTILGPPPPPSPTLSRVHIV